MGGGPLLPHHSTPPHPMKRFTQALAIYVAIGAVAVNIAGNLATNTAEGLQQIQNDRIEKLCQVNPAYCD